MVFIGSHSNRFVAANAATGAVLWEHEAEDRIEASAALSVCGKYISVGSFDGALYVLSIADGTVAWRYQTDDVVKSCPAVQPASDLMVFGSHDGLLHAIDVTRREPVWVYRLSPPEGDRGGRVATGPSPLSAPPAIFSSPAIDQVRNRVVAADLGGVVVCLALATPPTAANGSPVLLWRRVLKNPVFSSIAITPSGHIIVATVGAEVLCLDGECGEILWVFLTKGPVFSSPFIDPGTNSLFIGCHDHHVYRLDLDRGIQVWAADLGEKVYASPHGLCLANGALAVVCASTCGLVALLDGVTGATAATLQLPGEVFSSPVCCHASKRIYIGCRDDHLYCLDVVVTTTGQTVIWETPRV
jgi:acyl-CoA synthetase